MDAPIIEKVRDYVNRHGVELLEHRTGVWRDILTKMSAGEISRYKISTLDTLYSFFRIERDDFYTENMSKLKKRHESVFGKIMFEMRKKKKMKIEDVVRITKIDEKTIRRIEIGETLPNFGSYTLTQLVNLYDFTEEDKNTIGWLITISKDTQKILKRITSTMT